MPNPLHCWLRSGVVEPCRAVAGRSGAVGGAPLDGGVGERFWGNLRCLELTHQQEDDQDEQDQSAGAVVIATAGPTAAAEGEDQKDDEDNAECADCECATSELHER